jgi:iduronate 2-sulfatase
MKRLFVLCLLPALTQLNPINAEEPKPPRLNVLFVISDDLRNQLGCYGDPVVKSPNLDRLAAKGVRFDRAYCQYPVCNPSRTSVLTGLRPDTTRILGNTTQFRKELPDVVTLPELFRKNGYFTASLGKVFHRGQKVDDVRADMDDPRSWNMAKYFVPTEKGKQGEGRNLTDGKLEWCRWLAAEGDDEDQADGQIAAEAVKLLRQERKEPFFLAVGFHRPHDPFVAPRKYYDPYPLDKMPLWTAPKERTPDVPLAIPKGFDFSKFTDPERREFVRSYFAGVTFMDAQLGKVLDELDRQKLWESTVVIFWGDHGYHLGERDWWNKSTLFELSCRAPLFAYAPGMKTTGKSSSRLVEFVDMYPTICELCGIHPPDGLEGTSFRPLLDEPERAWKKAAFTQVQRGKTAGRSLRTERYRYTEWGDGGRQGIELYDHTSDPGEYKNLVEDPAHSKTAAELKEVLRAGWKSARPR